MTREEEVIYERGFSAGVDHQKKAAPPLRARELKKELDELQTAAAEFIAAQKSDAVFKRTAARNRLLALLKPTTRSTHPETTYEY